MKRVRQNLSFGSIAKQYQKYRRSYDPRLYKLLFSLLPARKLRIMDLGCGTGKSTEPLIAMARTKEVSVVGVDPDEAMLREARLSAKKKGLPIDYVVGSAEKLRFSGESFDVVTAGAAFHWFANRRALTRIRSILKDGGVFLVFWVRHLKTQKPTGGGDSPEIGCKIYGKYDWRGIPKGFKDTDVVHELIAGSGFKKVREATIPFVEKKTIAETIGCLKTNSSYIIMPPDIKHRFIKEMTQAYKDALGNRKYDTNRLELRVFYGFK